MTLRLHFRLVLLCCVLAGVGVALAAGQEPTPGWNTPWRNTDGSLKLALELGGGYNATVGGIRASQQSGWNVRLGGGYRVNRRYAALLEYNYDRFGIPQAVVATYPVVLQQSIPANAGSVHLWSFTLEPTVQYFSTEHYGGYFIGGGGFYRKVVEFSFSCPVGENCGLTPSDTTNLFSNNAGGVNIGTGLAWRVWDTSNTKFFFEVRYVWVDNTPSPHNSVFPSANERTSYVPVTAGLRW